MAVLLLMELELSSVWVSIMPNRGFFQEQQESQTLWRAGGDWSVVPGQDAVSVTLKSFGTRDGLQFIRSSQRVEIQMPEGILLNHTITA